MQGRSKHEGTIATVARILGAGLLACAAVALTAGQAAARPAYFENFKTKYSIAEASNLDACGVCHFRWTGTGARNPYGTTVEQQLYVGKSILQALTDVENMDPDADGYLSGDEIINYMTLPGYNCDNFTQAIGAPIDYDQYITPLVPTCLQPLDIRTTPTSLSAVIQIGDVRVMNLIVINNGSSTNVDVSDYSLNPGAPASLSLIGPTAPFSIPVGGTQVIQVVFEPTSEMFAFTGMTISSNDPDEPVLAIPITVAAVPDPTVSGAERGPCLATIAKATSKYAKIQLRTWSKCYLEELAGRVCDTGAHDLRLAKAAAKLASVVGGNKDKTCKAAGLNAASIGLPAVCGTGCEDLGLAVISDIPPCITCMQDRVMEGLLRDGMGTAPPDLPPNVIAGSDAYSCQGRILKAMQKGFAKMYALLAECELAAVFADEAGGACQSDLAASIDDLRATIDATADKCTDTTDLLGCRFEGMSPDPECLGLGTEGQAVLLTNTCFGLFEP